jgi:hypothetical protein
MNNQQAPKLMSSYAVLMPSNVPVLQAMVTVPRMTEPAMREIHFACKSLISARPKAKMKA